MNSVGAHSSSKVQVLQPDHHDGDSTQRQQNITGLERKSTSPQGSVSHARTYTHVYSAPFSSDKSEQASVTGPRASAYKETKTSSLKLDFHNVFIGNGKPTSERDGSFFMVELDKLSPAKVVQLYNDCKGRGFANALKPYLIDLLKRRESFQTVLEIFVSAVHEEENQSKVDQGITLPELLLELTSKDIFVSLLEVTPESAHGRLVSFYASLHCAIPFVYVLQTSRKQTKTVTNFPALQEILAVPSYPLVVSCGTENVVGRGKSNLTGKLVGLLETSSLSSDSFDIQTSKDSGGPTHLPSIDLALEVRADLKCGLNFVDVHGFTTEREFCHALSTLCSVAALILIHLAREDFDDSGAPGEGLESLLVHCCCLHRCDAEVVFLVRDVPRTTSGKADTLLSSVRPSLAKFLPNRVAQVIAVENLHACRTDSQRQKAVVRIRDQIRPLFQKLKHKLPCFEAINKYYLATLTSDPRPFKRRLSDLKDGFSKLGREVCEVLDRAMPHDGRLADCIFPLTAVYAAVARNRQREKELHEREVQSQQVASDLSNIARELRGLENQMLACQISEVVKFFAALIKHEKYYEIGEFQHYLEVWKAQYVYPLLEERRNLMNQLQSTGCLSDGAAGSSQAEEQESSMRHSLEMLSVRIDQLDISVDSFWSELMELCALQEDDEVDWDTLRKSCDLDPALVKQVYTQCVVEGYPMQLVRGSPLQMTANKFLKDVLFDLGSRSKNSLLVVSVIGAQSSAKSTLLNYLFGCGFATRAGRCTKGLYASYVTVSDGRRLLILDSEGLLSLEGGGHVFDGQITVMAMACSDIVIVNHKGEISSQMKELLEVCLYAMKYLKVADVRPELMFVLRDQRDRNTRVQNDALTLMKKLLKEATGSSQMNFDDLVSLRQDAVFLLPSAFSEQKRDGRTVEWPSAVFSEETFLLRSQMLRWADETQSAVTTSVEGDTPLVDWYSHACIVWETLTKYGHTLLHYKALYELSLHKEMNDLVKVIIKDVVESDTGLSGLATEIVTKHTCRLQTAKDKRAVDKYDKECLSELSVLRDGYQEEIYKEFDSRTVAKKYHEELKQKFRLKLTTPITHVYNVHLYTWQMQLKSTNDRLNIESLDRHFIMRTDEVLQSSEFQYAMSEADAIKVFEERWSEYEKEYILRLQETKRNFTDVRQEVRQVFSAVHSRHKHDNEMLSVVSLAAFTSQSKLTDGTFQFISGDNTQWFQQYLEVKAAKFYQEPIDALRDAVPFVHGTISSKHVIRVVVPEMKTTVQDFLDKVATALSEKESLDVAVVTSIVLAASNTAANIEKRCISYFHKRLKLRRAQFVNDLYVYLQEMTAQVVCLADEKRVQGEIKALEEMKEKKRRNFLDMVGEEADDVKRANAFAENYNEMLETWVTSRVLEFTSKIRDQVLKEMPNPEKGAHRAYNASFGTANYRDVLEYCLDVNAYLKKLFTQMFHKQKQAAIEQHETVLREDISTVYRKLGEFAELWQKSLDSAQFKSTDKVHLHDFKEFLQRQAADSSQPAAILSYRMAAVTNFPEVTNVGIARVDVFSKAFKQQIVGTYLPLANKTLDDKVAKNMDRERREMWVELKGCTAKCPLCGSKCSLVNYHTDHECAHHVLPAFHGSHCRVTHTTWLKMCRSSENANSRWCRGEDEPKANLAEYLEFYEDCKAWKKSIVPPDPTLKHVPEEQIQAWMNCKKPLIAHWNMVDDTPLEWSVYESKNPLAESEIDDALERLKEFQDI